MNSFKDIYRFALFDIKRLIKRKSIIIFSICIIIAAGAITFLFAVLLALNNKIYDADYYGALRVALPLFVVGGTFVFLISSLSDIIGSNNSIVVYSLPMSRNKILVSKIFGLVVISIAIVLAIGIFSIIVGEIVEYIKFIAWDSAGLNTNGISYSVDWSNITDTLLQMAVVGFVNLFIVSLGIMLAFATRSLMPTFVTVVLAFLWPFLFAAMLSYSNGFMAWFKYLPFIHLNFFMFFDPATIAQSALENIQPWFQFAVLLAWTIAFFVVAFVINNKRDIK